jgi:hypothetical protein
MGSWETFLGGLMIVTYLVRGSMVRALMMVELAAKSVFFLHGDKHGFNPKQK